RRTGGGPEEDRRRTGGGPEEDRRRTGGGPERTWKGPERTWKDMATCTLKAHQGIPLVRFVLDGVR
ncbi:MAG: hypothetical protein CMM47_01565, partial [Rhodospirillaceae bacterium]|nr:hypothetical protein [Rhodospirillaceae bacterium]